MASPDCMQSLEVEAPPPVRASGATVSTCKVKRKSLFAGLAVVLMSCLALASLKDGNGKMIPKSWQCVMWCLGPATDHEKGNAEVMPVSGVVPGSASSSLLMMPTPWWLQYGIEPEVEVDMGSWKANKFSLEQQAVFAVDENGEPTNTTKFEAAKTEIGKPMLVQSFSRYPGYEGPLQVEGSMTVRYICHKREWQLIWSLHGVDSACVDGAQEGVPNSCGIHIHVGTNCSDLSSVGGHYHSNEVQFLLDPWSSINLARGNNQANVNFGIQWPGVLGRVMVVHDFAGGRVACGEITKAVVANFIPGQVKPFPSHWGEPPMLQTKDLREWPEGYGRGSGTVAHWIQKHLDEDAAVHEKAPTKLIPGQVKPFPRHWGEPPVIQTMDIREWPEGYGQGSGTIAYWIQQHLDEDAAVPESST